MKKRTFLRLGIPLSGVLLIVTALTGGCAAVSSAPPAQVTATPVATEDPKFKEELRLLEVFLDANVNTALEDELRQDINRSDDPGFLQKYPEWKNLTLDHPTLPAALKTEKRFLLHRSFARMSGHLPIEARQLQQLDVFLDAHAAIQDALEFNPALLTNPDFLLKNPALAAFFDQHPDLFTVFSQNAGARIG